MYTLHVSSKLELVLGLYLGIFTKRPDAYAYKLTSFSVTGWMNDFSFAFEISCFHGCINRSAMDNFLAHK